MFWFSKKRLSSKFWRTQLQMLMKPIKALQHLSTTSKDKLKQFGAWVPIGFELDPNITSTHVSGKNELDHVSKNYS